MRQAPSPWPLLLRSQQLQLPWCLMWSTILRCFVIGYFLRTLFVCMLPAGVLRDWLLSPYIVCLHAVPPAATAPSLWAALLDLVTTADARGILVSIELPASDAGWCSPEGRALQAKYPFVTSFCFCAFGGPCGRSAILSNADAFESLSTPCLGTAVPACLERPYTWHFCQTVSSLRAHRSWPPAGCR